MRVVLRSLFLSSCWRLAVTVELLVEQRKPTSGEAAMVQLCDFSWKGEWFFGAKKMGNFLHFSAWC